MGAILLNPIAACFIQRNIVHKNTPPVILIFGPLDPTGASSLLADAVTFSHFGCHAVAASTASLVRDSSMVEEVQPTSPEHLDDQARCLLEDMPIKAIKVGAVYSIETISIIAQIVADYSDLPLVLQPSSIPSESIADDIDAEEAESALLELLLPQTDIVITKDYLLEHWQAHGVLNTGIGESPPQSLLSLGTKWVVSASKSTHHAPGEYTLYGRRNLNKPIDLPLAVHNVLDAEGPLACAVTAAMAKGMDAESAAEAAAQMVSKQMQTHFQAGMGKLFYNRSSNTTN